MIAPTDCGDPYLKRPISVLWADENSIELLVAVKGRGTKMLVERPIGAKLPAVGFLGKPFPKPLEPDGHAFLVGGGVGVPPMYMLARALREDGFEGKITAVIGARTCSAVLLAADFAKYSDVVCATDDGSEGEKGNAAQVFEKTVEKTGVKSATAYACGPLPMMKGVAKAAAARGFSVWVSLEERMGCGTGVCMGCSAAMKSGKYARVCTEGAVFSAYDVEGFIE